jgi:hypothetical protein
MKKLLLFSIVFFSFVFLYSDCNSQIPKGIYKFAGLWEMKVDGMSTYEFWEINPDSSLQGKDFEISSKNDTTIYELMQIICKDNEVYYVARVMEQNEGKPIYFKLIEFTPMVFVFENKEHDFPQMLTYSRKTDDLYAVIIEGPDNGKIKSIEFRFTRKQQ